jgi:type I restriction enzyme S subunit
VTYAEVEIETVCDTGSGGTPSRAKQDMYFGGIIPWVKSGELRESIITQTEESLTEAGLNESAAKLVPKDALLVALYGATVGRVGILGIEAATNQAVCHIIPDTSRVDHRYLFHALRSKAPFWLSQRVGGGQPNISQGVIKKTKIPLPPLSEQKRIAEILDRAEALRSKRRAALALLDELTQSIFDEMFGDPVSNPKGWDDSRTLADVASIGSGITKGRRTSEPVRAVPYLAVVNVQDKMLDLSVVKTIEATEKEIDRYRLKKNDLLLTEGGDADKLGRGTLWNDELSECIHQNHIFRVRLTTNDVAPLFLNWLVGGQRGKSYFLSQAKQTTGIATINMTQLKAFPMLIPSRKLQDDFAKRILRIEDIRSSKMSSLNELDQLFASLQHRAFRGEL